MRDRDRLERLENGSSFSSDDITFLLKQARLYQISRDDTREKCSLVRKQNKELNEQNRRYREAIENTQAAIRNNLSRWSYKDEVSLYNAFVHNRELLEDEPYESNN